MLLGISGCVDTPRIESGDDEQGNGEVTSLLYSNMENYTQGHTVMHALRANTEDILRGGFVAVQWKRIVKRKEIGYNMENGIITEG